VDDRKKILVIVIFVLALVAAGFSIMKTAAPQQEKVVGTLNESDPIAGRAGTSGQPGN
jgi:hypothetical protein